MPLCLFYPFFQHIYFPLMDRLLKLEFPFHSITICKLKEEIITSCTSFPVMCSAPDDFFVLTTLYNITIIKLLSVKGIGPIIKSLFSNLYSEITLMYHEIQYDPHYCHCSRRIKIYRNIAPNQLRI